MRDITREIGDPSQSSNSLPFQLFYPVVIYSTFRSLLVSVAFLSLLLISKHLFILSLAISVVLGFDLAMELFHQEWPLMEFQVDPSSLFLHSCRSGLPQTRRSLQN